MTRRGVMWPTTCLLSSACAPKLQKVSEIQMERPTVCPCFANGWANCPRYFTELLKPVYAFLRAQGFLSLLPLLMLLLARTDNQRMSRKCHCHGGPLLDTGIDYFWWKVGASANKNIEISWLYSELKKDDGDTVSGKGRWNTNDLYWFRKQTGYSIRQFG